MKTMKPPLTNTQEVLYTLIKQGYVNFYDFPTLIGLRTRISTLKLKYGIKTETIKANRCNKFGRKFTYHTHRLKDKEHAIKIYEKLTLNN